MNGYRLTLSNDAAYELVMQVTAGQLDSVDDIAAILTTATQPPPDRASTGSIVSGCSGGGRAGL